MGLFSKKKEETTNEDKANLPKFPEFPRINNMQQPPALPSYEKEFIQEKDEGLRPKQLPKFEGNADIAMDLPARIKTPFEEKFAKAENFPMPKMDETERVSPRMPQQRMPSPERNPFNVPLRMDHPIMDESPQPVVAGGERPLFIKVEEYREAMGNIENLKKTLKETEELLDKIESIRMAEEEELKRCQQNVDAIKEQLLFIDKRLFEV